MKPRFSTLIILTLVSAVLLLPFALSPWYIEALRDRAFDLHQFLRGELYKQITGYIALALVLAEMLLTARKRSRSWPIRVKMPGSVLMWRSLHIFTGVALLAAVLVHTLGVSGINYNAIFLWSFFGVTLSALVGVVAETGVLESPRKVFSLTNKRGSVKGDSDKKSTWESAEKKGATGRIGMSKGELIRAMRSVWLQSHIFLVGIFALLLAVHIFLVYYYR
ncbi:hypothetical protein [cf. Phormidesmis sp. LEGE 11477]|uniref:hypothetical protein n=1 Tax=cf. Phormidesmis sp. LEGE 11477 TaxID=1828680 RepID=UPI0018816230|nr:hypothetical protein [cf. Phormidesmis sp. LEGE 11477]MBE9059924.1 hypothetical protein [cf. Phormidesmis sp. LEGE 11477]